jgi:hypothetical protein
MCLRRNLWYGLQGKQESNCSKGSKYTSAWLCQQQNHTECLNCVSIDWKALCCGHRGYETVYPGNIFLKMKTLCTSASLVPIYETTQCQKPEDRNMHLQRSENLRSCTRLGVCSVGTDGRRILHHNCQVHHMRFDF